MEPAAIRPPSDHDVLGADAPRDGGRRTCPKTNIVTDDGSRIRPDWVMQAPKP